eukprot:6095496-Amphidinium_carterae.1
MAPIFAPAEVGMSSFGSSCILRLAETTIDKNRPIVKTPTELLIDTVRRECSAHHNGAYPILPGSLDRYSGLLEATRIRRAGKLHACHWNARFK